MKKKLFITIGYLLLLALAIGLITAGINYYREHRDDGAQKYGTAKTACQILTKSRVSKVMNSSSKQTGSTKLKPIAKDVRASICSYKQTIGESDAVLITASLSLQSPTSSKSVASVQSAFSTAKASMKLIDKKLQSYGSDSFWDYKTGELNFLSHHVWYKLGYGPTNLDDRSIPQTEELGDQLLADIDQP